MIDDVQRPAPSWSSAQSGRPIVEKLTPLLTLSLAVLLSRTQMPLGQVRVVRTILGRTRQSLGAKRMNHQATGVLRARLRGWRQGGAREPWTLSRKWRLKRCASTSNVPIVYCEADCENDKATECHVLLTSHRLCEQHWQVVTHSWLLVAELLFVGFWLCTGGMRHDRDCRMLTYWLVSC